tara:strand:+ start:4320 stop:4748 length:429 start_codon:yes stop_codon:yes gene_type:complete
MMNESNFLGKLLFLVIIIIASCYHSLLGVLLVLLYIIFYSNTIENFESNQDKSSKDSVSSFKEKYCENGKLTKDGKTYQTPESIKEAFPNIKFTNSDCNPCDDSCEFEIISSSSLLNNEENLRATNSNQVTIDRNAVSEKKE